MNKFLLNAKKYYHRQRYSAKRRGIVWDFTLNSWIEWWLNTGKAHLRGNKKGQYMMCRIMDVGIYSPNTVYCATNNENIKDAYKYNKDRKKKSFLSNESKIKISKALKGKYTQDKNSNYLGNKEIERRKNIIDKYDLSKHGTISQLARLFNISHTQVRRFINKYYLI